MIMKWFLIFACVLLGTHEAAYVDTINACALQDAECFKNFMQNTLKIISIEGIKEYDIPPVDPIDVKDINVKVLNLMNVTIKEGTVRGIKDCVVNKFEFQMENGKATIDVLCDINITGKTKISGSSPALEGIFGNKDIRGDGNFGLELTKLQMILFGRYKLVKRDNGDIHMKFLEDGVRYKYTLGGAHITGDNIFLGDGEKDESAFVTDYLNKNYKLVVRAFGNNFFNIAIKIIHEKIDQYTDKVSTKYFIKDDLSSYLKNDE